MKPLWQVDEIRRLMKVQAEEAAAQEREVEEWRAAHATPPKVVIEQVKLEAEAQPPTLQPNYDETPPRLRGLTLGAIRLLEVDEGLTPFEEEWLAGKSPPDPLGYPQMPNFVALRRRAEKLNKT